jgi:hypothetical protein
MTREMINPTQPKHSQPKLPTQFKPTQFNPTQFNPIQFNPTQPNPTPYPILNSKRWPAWPMPILWLSLTA